MTKRLEIEEVRLDNTLDANTVSIRLVDVASTRRLEEEKSLAPGAVTEEALQQWLIELTEELPSLHVGNVFVSKDRWDELDKKIHSLVVVMRRQAEGESIPMPRAHQLIQSLALRRFQRTLIDFTP